MALDNGQDTPPLEASAVLDALTRYALWQGDLTAARQLADEHVRLAGQADVPVLYGRALLDRSRVRVHTGNLEAAIADAEQAVTQFQAAANGLWESRAREALAEAYAQAGRFAQAFESQRAVTRGVEKLFRDYHQQRALVGQIAQQAREAEVRAEAMAQAALSDPLTGIPNRTRAMQVLTRLQEQAATGECSAIALMDLDHFKRVNDTYGHLVGDARADRGHSAADGRVERRGTAGPAGRRGICGDLSRRSTLPRPPRRANGCAACCTSPPGKRSRRGWA